MVINVLDVLQLPASDNPVDIDAAYTTAVTTAIANAKDGDRIYIPGVRPIVAPEAGWHVDKSLEILGDGPGGEVGSGTGTILTTSSVTEGGVFVLGNGTDSVPNVSIHDLAIAGSGGQGLRDGIRFRPGGNGGTNLSSCLLERLKITGCSGAGLHLGKAAAGQVKASFAVNLRVNDVIVESCGGPGIDLEAVYVGEFVRVRSAMNGREGLKCGRSGVVIQGCSFEANKTAVGAGGLAECDASLCAFVRIDACSFRDFAGSGSGVGLALTTVSSAMITGCDFYLTTIAPGAVGIAIHEVLGFPSGPAAILANRFIHCGVLVSADSTVRGVVVFPELADLGTATIQLPTAAGSAPMGEATAGTNNAGLLLPGFNTPIPPEPTGMTNKEGGALFYSLDTNVLYSWINGSWQAVNWLP